MAAAVTPGPTLATLSGTKVLMYPVPTAWPLSAGCDKYIYRQSNGGLILAYDVMYPLIVEAKAASCFHTENSLWWLQADGLSTSTALGPTFACPQSYSAVHSIVESDAAAATHYTYCCPPGFQSGTIFPTNVRSVNQCTSTVQPGGTVSYMTFTNVNNAQTVSPTSTVVAVSVATVFAPPVNGYNIVRRAVDGASSDSSVASTTGTGSAGTTGGSRTAGNSQSTSPPGGSGLVDPVAQSSGPSSSTIAGAAIGGVIGILLLVAVAFFLGRRRRSSAATTGKVDNGTPDLAGGDMTGAGPDGTKGYYGHASPQSNMSATPVKYFPAAAHELPQQNVRHELGYQEHQRFELPGQQDAYRPSGGR